jgi:hypothetical protein
MTIALAPRKSVALPSHKYIHQIAPLIWDFDDLNYALPINLGEKGTVGRSGNLRKLAGRRSGFVGFLFSRKYPVGWVF